MLNMNIGMEGIVHLHKGKMDANGIPITRHKLSKFNNMVLDTGLQRIGTNSDYMNWLHLGTGVLAPHPLQSSLQNPTYKGNTYAPGKHTTSGVNIENPQAPYVWIKRVYRVTPRGENRTYAELGVGWNDTTLFSRTLVKDPQGLPNTISVLGDEYLDVTYELRLYMPINTVVDTIVPTGDDVEPRTVTARAAMMSTPSVVHGWTLAYQSTVDSPISLLSNWSSSIHNQFYTGIIGGLYQRPEGVVVGSGFNYSALERTSDTSAKYTLDRGLPDNVGLLKSLLVSSSCFCYQIQFDPPFNKDNESRFNYAYSISWGRYVAP